MQNEVQLPLFPEPRRKRRQHVMHNVLVDGVRYRSVRAAYAALGYDMSGHEAFRQMLKQAGRLTCWRGRVWKTVPRLPVSQWAQADLDRKADPHWCPNCRN
jgi:hypothetical protein